MTSVRQQRGSRSLTDRRAVRRQTTMIQPSFVSQRPPLTSTKFLHCAHDILPVRNAQVPLDEVNTAKLSRPICQSLTVVAARGVVADPAAGCSPSGMAGPTAHCRPSPILAICFGGGGSVAWTGQLEKIEHIAAHHLSHVGSREQVAHFLRPVQRVGHPLGVGVIRTEQDALG